ncbi:LysR family transcriptional regulator [Hoeflea prorocentri]|uniref:LysR family transcriptional regulator n=1 Tax=Hoeflea prorocentri TaxID=1922333 RepID=A0A9X3UH64_9HYPH|nr:LysR family transcriptional regulator [Hoeflea prorocentri]MCY6379188.1 LysR family transcriptional regulator [Hoeflea prorocentri]MDA5396989.1 LysR family transcriptional regulator [Hoeflea prorocentri]
MDTLTRIRAFIDVVEAEGFSAAARKNGRSKALLSKYVRELEDDLGALLLNRTTRQFSLTEAGHTYYRSASDILKEIDNLADLVRESNRDLKGTIRVSAPRTFTDADIGRSMIDFAIENPEIKLEITSDDRFVDLVEEGFDVAIRITRLADSGLIARKLAPFKAYICASPDFIKRHPELKHPSDLANVPCITDTNSRSLNNWHFRGESGATETVSVKGPIEVNSPSASMKAVRAGVGVSALPDFVAWPLLKSGEIVTLFDEYMPDDAGIYAVYPHRRYLPAKVRAFVDYLAAWFKQYGGYCDR